MGEDQLTEEEIADLVAAKAPLVRLRGQPVATSTGVSRAAADELLVWEGDFGRSAPHSRWRRHTRSPQPPLVPPPAA